MNQQARKGFIIGLSSLLVVSVFAGIITSGNATLICTNRVNVTAFPQSYTDNVNYQCSAKGITTTLKSIPKHSWGADIFNVTGGTTGRALTINVTGAGFIGNSFDLWVTTDKTLTTAWFRLGTTPSVHTDSHLVAPTINVLWDGTGKTQSQHVFVINIPAGTSLFIRVDGKFFGQMGKALDRPCGGISTLTLLTFGCTATGISVAPNWNPQPYTIKFS